METNTTELTQQEMQLLEGLNERERDAGKTRLRLGLILLPVAILTIIGGWHDINVRSIGILLFILGTLITIFAIGKRRRSKRQTLPQDITKKQITDILVHTTLSNHGVICYTFKECQIELYIPMTNSINQYGDFSYNSLIDKADILVGTSVTLSYLTFKPGINLLMDIRYEAYRHNEMIVPVDTSDIDKVETKIYKSNRIILGTAVIVIILWNLDGGFSIERTLLIFLFFAAIIVFMFYSSSKKKLAQNKLVIRTTITEVLNLLSEDELTYYRLADGTLVHVSSRQYDPGDAIEIQVMEDSSGRKETFITKITM
ncbi:hypothetical protein SAMN05428949_0305 [Chitinophaga sp. YR627]|uniref:hypothetical protein n=1 Tax=Chitinophaga sp. YR627 TaxID=1881041 RepID=UPI0008EC61BF|nr:hypothetical protein [Chitinophaga sp. YR627]SFM65057.1 hypothetical protein SAMN05428949_0305 [Chitinophaga sp. YR627]